MRGHPGEQRARARGSRETRPARATVAGRMPVDAVARQRRRGAHARPATAVTAARRRGGRRAPTGADQAPPGRPVARRARAAVRSRSRCTSTAPPSSGCADRDRRVRPLQTSSGQRQLAERRRGERERQHRGADVVPEPGQGQLLGAHRAADAVGRLDEQDPAARPRPASSAPTSPFGPAPTTTASKPSAAAAAVTRSAAAALTARASSSGCAGMLARTVVPAPGADSTSSAADRAEPVVHVHEAVAQRRCASRSKPAPSSRSSKHSCSSLEPATRNRRAVAGVLAGVLHRLEAAEVRGGLGLFRVSAGKVDLDRTRQRQPRRGGAQRLAKPAVAQQRRVDAVRELAQLGDRGLHVAAQVLEQREHGLGVAVLGDLAGQPELDRQRDEVLLRAVVQVALDGAARRVGGGDDAQPRGLQLLVALGSSASDACSAESSRTLCRARPS